MSDNNPANAINALRDIAADERRNTAETHKKKLDAINHALAIGVTKDAIARNLGISRPTLDGWIRDRDDRILFNDALALMTHPLHTTATTSTPAHSGNTPALTLMYDALGVRDTKTQAAAVLEGMHHMAKGSFTPEQSELIQRAITRAWELM